MANLMAPVAYVEHMTSPIRYLTSFSRVLAVSFSLTIFFDYIFYKSTFFRQKAVCLLIKLRPLHRLGLKYGAKSSSNQLLI